MQKINSKRLLALILAIVMMVGVFPPIAMAGESFTETDPAWQGTPREINFTGREWAWSDAVGTNPGGTPATNQMDVGAGQIAGGGNGVNAFQIGAENARSRYFMYETREQAIEFFTLYPFGKGDDFEALFQDSPSSWILNLNSEDDWYFRFDRAPRYRPWPQSAVARPLPGQLNADGVTRSFDPGGDNPIFGTTVHNNFLFSGLVHGGNTAAAGASATGTNALTPDDGVTRSGRFPAGVYGFDVTETYTQTTGTAVTGLVPASALAAHGVTMPGALNHGNIPLRQTTQDGWHNITVPGMWHMNWNDDGTFMFDRIIYVNQPNPYTGQYGNPWASGIGTGNQYASGVLPAPPEVYNGVGTYQRDFVIGPEWADKRVFLNLDGADSFYVWVNGIPVGFSDDKFTHTEFDITDALRIRQDGSNEYGSVVGNHTITVQLIRWSTGSNFEIQDFVRISGIFRSIYLMARNMEDLWDFQVDTRPVNPTALRGASQDTDWTFHLRTLVRDFPNPLRDAGESRPVRFELLGPDGSVVASYNTANTVLRDEYGTGTPVAGSPANNTGTYRMHVTNLGRDSFLGVFGDGVRFNADAANRTALDPYTTRGPAATHPAVYGTIASAETNQTRVSLAKPAEFMATIPADEIQLWSPEAPNLYQLVVWVDNGEETMYTSIKVGFRYVELESAARYAAGNHQGRLFINGRLVTFRGTNVHEVNPWYGHTMPLGIIRRDLQLMRQHNMNGLRMAHYPHDARYYDLAAIYGLFIMDEANIEVHFSGHGSLGNITNRAFSGPLTRDRQLNMFERTKNFPSVVMWSNGNESGISAQTAGYTLQALEKREADITQRGRGRVPGIAHWSTAREANDRAGRPTHSEWGNPGRHLGQLWTQMYPEINAWSQHGGDGNPVINCELSHMMGNSGGNFDSWTWISESRNHDIGTFIWEFIDQAIYAPFRSSSLQVGGTTIEPFYQSPSETGRWDAPADPSELSWFFSVGGDWGDARTDGSFMACGLMGADRVPFPAASEVRRQYQNIRAFMTPAQEQAITAGSIDFTVLNRYMFTNANNFDMTWDITENGRIIRSGTDVLDVNPIPHGRGQNAGTGGSRFTRDMLTQEAVTITFDPILPLPNAEYHFNIRFHEREELPWMSIGGYLNDPDAVPWAIDDHCFVEDGPWAVSTSQIPITAAALRNPALPNPPMSVLEMTVSGDLEANNEGAITITGPDARFVYVFDKEEGVFTSMSYGGREFITSGPEPSFFRAVSCNELGIGGRNAAIQGWRNAATDRLRGATTTTVSQDGNVVTIVAQFMNPGRNMTSLNNRTVYTIFPDGEVNVEQTYQWGASVGVLPEIGTRMTLVPGLDNVTYFGRGPDENYTDRRWGNDVGVWETTVADMFTPYLTTQFMGNRIDTRWAALTDDDGFGIVVTAGDFGANNVYRGSAAAYNPNQIPRNADSMFEFYALYYTMQELDGPRPSTRHNRQPERMFHTLGRPNAAGANNPIYLNINLASWGVGGDQSWGADARGQYQINYANSTYTYNFNIRPVTNFNNFDHYASREVRNFRDNVSDLVPLAIAAGVPATHPAITAAINLPSNATDVAAANVYTALINVMADIRPVVNFATVAGVSAMPNTNNEIRLTVPEGVEIDALAPVFETVGTGGAAVTIYPTGPQDFTDGPVAFTLTVNGVTNTYLVFVEPFMAAKSITSFELAGQAGIITYDSDGNGHILVDLSARADNATLNLVPQISSTGVRIEPSQTVAQDFAAPVTYTVHARDGSYRTYTVTVLAFGGVTPFINTLTALDNYVGIIDHVNRNISVLLPFGSNPASVPVAITAHGIVTGPVPGTTEDDVHSFVIDATNPVTFTVTLDSVSRAYTVNVVVDPGLGTDIYTFAIDGNAGVIDLNARTIAVTVPIGTELGGVTPEMTLSIGATVHAPTLPVNFVPGEPMEFTVRSASGTVEDIWTVSVMVSRDVEGIDPAQFLDPRATGLVFATDTTLGISVLPETVDLLVSAGVGNPPVSVEADVTWTSPPPLARYQTITVHGAAVIPGAPGIAPSDPFPISAQLEVLPPDTVVWISAGMGERPHLNAPAASLIGSVFFDAVEEFLGDQLLNNVPSRPSPNATGNEPGAEWGAKAGEGGTGTAPANNAAVRNRIFHIQGPGARNYMDLRTQRGYYTGAPVTGSGGGNQPGNRVEYRLPLLQPGMYTIAIGTTEFWSGPRNARVDIMTGTGTNPANFATDPNVIASGPISVSGGGNTARLVLQFVLTEETTPIVRMTTTSSDDPILTYLIVSADDARIPLRETIEEAEAVNQSLFTPESVEAMDQALQAAQLVYGNPEASQAAMIEATANLRAAIDALVPMLPSLTAIHPDELVSHGANRATAPFFATTPELGIEGLPETIRMRNDHHDTENEAAYVVADVTWTAPAGGFPLHATVLNVAGVATAPNHMAPFNLTATVEVVDPNTVVWINAGTGESGSALFEAVRRFLPDGQLRNDASCQQGDPLTGNPAGAIWGHKRGEGSTVANQNRSTTVRTEGGFAGAKIQSGIYTHSHPDGPPNTGNVGNNAVGNRIEYRLPQLNAGTYTFTIHAQDWWAEWYAAANARRIQVQVLTATGETALENVQILHTTPTTVVPGSGPGGGGPQTSGTITGTFTLDEAAMPILRFLNDGVAGAQRDPVFSWIQVVEVVEEPTGPQLLTFNIPGYGIHDGAVIDSVNRTALFEIPAGQGHNWQQVPFSILVSPGARLIEPYPAAFQGDPSIGPDGTTYNFNDTWFDDVPGSTIMRAIHLAYGTGAGQITVVYTVTVTLTEPTIPPHTISWALVGGAWSGEFTPPATVADGGTIAAIAEANLPTRDGFTFTGWAPELPLEDVTGPVTVTAQWDRDGDGMTLVLETVTAAPGESVEVSLSVENNVGLSTADIHIEFADDDIEL
ncbi:MAG: DUF4981 domain-containing protein, partial [Oscillospiraceae bacterium]|nr:DUF4981 domain-containing protein [Oscillospiraceae bacterium]